MRKIGKRALIVVGVVLAVLFLCVIIALVLPDKDKETATTPIAAASATTVLTPTPEATETSMPVATLTPVSAPTDTPTPESTDTRVPEPTETPVPAPTDTRPPEPTETPTPPPISGPKLVVAEHHGRVVPEYIVIANIGDQPQDMTGWRLHSITADQWYGFPPGFVLQAATKVRVYSACDTAPTGHLHWTEKNMWNNKGDPCCLVNSENTIVDRRDR